MSYTGHCQSCACQRSPHQYIYLWNQPCCPMCIFVSVNLHMINKHIEPVVLTVIYWESSSKNHHIPCNRNGVLLVFGSCFTPSGVWSFSQSICPNHHAFHAAFQWAHRCSSSVPVLQPKRGQIISIIITELSSNWKKRDIVRALFFVCLVVAVVIVVGATATVAWVAAVVVMPLSTSSSVVVVVAVMMVMVVVCWCCQWCCQWSWWLRSSTFYFRE